MKKAIDIDLKEGAGIKTAVDIVIFNKKGQVLFGERLAVSGNNCWGFPGGHQKTGEKIRETAGREIKIRPIKGKTTKPSLSLLKDFFIGE